MHFIIQPFFNNFINIPGWRTKRKLVVIESDDWGSIRMPSNEVFNDLEKSGIDLRSDEGFRFNKFDSLETSYDLASLFEVLSSVKDSTGRPAVLTPVSVVANPDFSKILESDYNDYYFEPFTETLKRYPDCENTFTNLREGIDRRLFVPQFHGREHLNVKAWMRALKNRNNKTIIAFNFGMWGITTANDHEIGVEFQAAFDFVDKKDLYYQKEVIISGLDLFEKLFGYRATYFVPPNGPFSSQLERICSSGGIKYLSTSKLQVEPLGEGRSKRAFHWLGQKNDFGLIFITRNCFFEPSLIDRNWIDSCLKDISLAFRWNKPAVISSHRVNYIGALHKSNRDNGLKKLLLLLKSIMKAWPKAEFVTSEELGQIISNG